MIAMQTFLITFTSCIQAAFTTQCFADMGDKRQIHAQKHAYNTCTNTYIHVHAYLNPSVWEYQSATLDCIYHIARQSSTTAGDILDITQ